MNERRGRSQTGGGQRQGTAPTNAASGDAPSAGPETQRAEEVLDQMTQTVSQFAARVGLQILKGAALAREEAEDIWAEAQAKRRGQS